MRALRGWPPPPVATLGAAPSTGSASKEVTTLSPIFYGPSREVINLQAAVPLPGTYRSIHRIGPHFSLMIVALPLNMRCIGNWLDFVVLSRITSTFLEFAEAFQALRVQAAWLASTLRIWASAPRQAGPLASGS